MICSWQFLPSPSERRHSNWETSPAAGRGTTQKNPEHQKSNQVYSWMLSRPDGWQEAWWSIFSFMIWIPPAVRLARVLTRLMREDVASSAVTLINLGLNCSRCIQHSTNFKGSLLNQVQFGFNNCFSSRWDWELRLRTEEDYQEDCPQLARQSTCIQIGFRIRLNGLFKIKLSEGTFNHSIKQCLETQLKDTLRIFMVKLIDKNFHCHCFITSWEKGKGQR